MITIYDNLLPDLMSIVNSFLSDFWFLFALVISIQVAFYLVRKIMDLFPGA